LGKNKFLLDFLKNKKIKEEENNEEARKRKN